MKLVPVCRLPDLPCRSGGGSSHDAHSPPSATRSSSNPIKGSWTGPGEIVAGKYKGTKFNCTFDGTTPAEESRHDAGRRLPRRRVHQKMTASIEQKGGRYQGKFLDGAEGKGMDVISGSVVDGGQKVVLAINRKQLNGVMQARIADANTMNVTISVRVEKQLVPVIGMSLKRINSTATGSIAAN